MIIAAAATAALIAAYWFVILAPKREEAAKLDADIAAKKQELATARATLGSYRDAKDGYSRNYATVVRLGKAVPRDDDTRSLLVQLEGAAGRSGVDFLTLSVEGSSGASGASSGTTPTVPGTVAGNGGFAVMPFSFAFRGNFANMSQFFSRLERFVTIRNSRVDVTGRLLRVESIVLKPDPLGFPNLRAEIGASSYQLAETDGAARQATAAGPAGAAEPASDGSTKPPTTTATATGVTP